MTVHQAKGLEFPVVILWDGRCPFRTYEGRPPWRMDRDARGWAIGLQDLKWEEPEGLDLAGREKRYAEAERKRVVYVAATRARDLLVLPKAPASKPAQHIYASLIAGADPSTIEELEPYELDEGATWARAVPTPVPPEWGEASHLEQEVSTRWVAAAEEASRPRFRPVAVTGEAKAAERETDEILLAPAAKRAGRYGPIFGDTVHRAIGIVMRDLPYRRPMPLTQP
jgi:ATP-dependent helicase/nuclease subunit A